MPDFYGITVDENYEGRLVWTSGAPPGYNETPLSQKDGWIIHYGGGATNWDLGALAIWQSYARYHQRPGGFASGVSADGLQYHLGAEFDGRKCGLVKPTRTRWHCGSWPENGTWVAISIPIGGQQDATYAQKVAMEEMIHEGITKHGVGQDIRKVVKGHQEVGLSNCPGVLQQSFVNKIQSGHSFTGKQPEPKRPQANHLVVQVPGLGEFWIIHEMYKRYAMCPEPMTLFGFPIEGMKGDPPYHNFERARLEVVPGSWADRHDVQLGHVGKELAQKRYGSKFTNKEDQFDPEQSTPDSRSTRFFKQTGHTINHGFKSFWEDWDGLEYFGYPISREFKEDGKTVQYFERARFEHHPGYDSIYHDVLLGRVNAELLGV